jgi:hypothetical protein
MLQDWRKGIHMTRNNIGSAVSSVFIALAIGLFSLVAATPSRAQLVPAQQHSSALAADVGDSIAAPALSFEDQPLTSDTELPTVGIPATPPTPQVGEPTSDWHFDVSPYLWFPGVHGTIGARDHDASIHVSPGDLLSNFRFGLMGLVDTRYKRIVLPLDLMWVRLGTNNALALTDEAVTARIRASEFILTPKIGYRVVDTEMIKVDALVGFRYWHFGESLSFNPSDLGIKFSASQNWVDPLVGGRITGYLSPKVVVTIAGDVGGWGTGSQLDYQIVAALGYRIKPAVILQAGYRYLAVDYRSGGSIINTVTSGALIGATFTLK